MKLGELLERLHEVAEDSEDGLDVEVRLMTQESYPFENSIKGVTTRQEMLEECPTWDDDEEEPEVETNIVYVVEGKQLCSGSKAAWFAIS